MITIERIARNEFAVYRDGQLDSFHDTMRDAIARRIELESR